MTTLSRTNRSPSDENHRPHGCSLPSARLDRSALIRLLVQTLEQAKIYCLPAIIKGGASAHSRAISYKSFAQILYSAGRTAPFGAHRLPVAQTAEEQEASAAIAATEREDRRRSYLLRIFVFDLGIIYGGAVPLEFDELCTSFLSGPQSEVKDWWRGILGGLDLTKRTHCVRHALFRHR